jgi:hypothetical protein
MPRADDRQAGLAAREERIELPIGPRGESRPGIVRGRRDKIWLRSSADRASSSGLPVSRAAEVAGDTATEARSA